MILRGGLLSCFTLRPGHLPAKTPQEAAAQSTAKAEVMVDSGESVHRLVPEAEQVPARPPACPRSQVRAVLRQGLGAPERWTA